jgi:SWIM zinc finger
MEARSLKAQEPADRGRVVRDGDGWLVYSLTSVERYRVALVPPSCSCPDFELRRDDCKHRAAVRIICSRKGSLNVREEPITLPPVAWPRKTYQQPDWAAYDAAQMNEKDEFFPLLQDLCSGIEDTPRLGRGRPSLPFADQVFAACLKVYVGMSGRRAACDPRTAHENGFLSQVPHHASISRYLESEELTPILTALIVRSALPLKGLESEFAVDSTGFSGCKFDRWYEEKWGRMRSEQEWVKAHAMAGTLTHIITAVEVLEKDSND